MPSDPEATDACDDGIDQTGTDCAAMVETARQRPYHPPWPQCERHSVRRRRLKLSLSAESESQTAHCQPRILPGCAAAVEQAAAAAAVAPSGEVGSRGWAVSCSAPAWWFVDASWMRGRLRSGLVSRDRPRPPAPTGSHCLESFGISSGSRLSR